MNEKAAECHPNGARAYAIVANLVLAVTLAYFFYNCPQQLKKWMVIGKGDRIRHVFYGIRFIIHNSYHDIVSVISGFWSHPFAGIFKGLIDRKYKGVVNLLEPGVYYV